MVIFILAGKLFFILAGIGVFVVVVVVFRSGIDIGGNHGISRGKIKVKSKRSSPILSWQSI